MGTTERRAVLDYGTARPRPRWWTYPLWWIGATVLVVSVLLALTMLINFLGTTFQ